MLTGGSPPQRSLAHQILNTLLPMTQSGLRDPQTAALLSAIWHEARSHAYGTPFKPPLHSPSLALLSPGTLFPVRQQNPAPLAYLISFWVPTQLRQ